MAPNPGQIMSLNRLVGLSYNLVLDINRRTMGPLRERLQINPVTCEQLIQGPPGPLVFQTQGYIYK
jgi:hypothetical protein